MTRIEGEHELVLGNKQLLSAFFVVVILLGVFFTMGYFVGKNTATAGFSAGQPASSDGPRVDPAGKAVDTSSPPPSAPPDGTASAADTGTSSAPVSAPPVDSSAAKEPRPVESRSAESRAEERPVEARPREDSSSRSRGDSSESLVQPGGEQMYLQVAAVRRSDADNMVKVLRERGFPALLGESSKAGLYRVLVGPFKTMTDLGHTKSDLKSKGFDSIVAK